MKDFMSKFKIPTLLGLSIIFLGIVAGVYLNLKDQIFLSQAAPNLTPQNITLTNITEESVTISWQTRSGAASFVTFGQNNSNEQTALDDQDNPAAAGPKPHLIHYATLENLTPKTNYQFKVISGKVSSEIEKFQTAGPLTDLTGFAPVIGSALDGNTPLNDGIAYLSIAGAITQSAQIKTGGSFLIPLSFIRKTDLSDIYLLSENTIGKITVASEKGTASILFKLKNNSPVLPPVKLGQNIDLTIKEPAPQESPVDSELSQYDLNNDGTINSLDRAVILQNLGSLRQNSTSGIKNIKADINKDGVVDQKDLDLLTQKLKNLRS